MIQNIEATYSEIRATYSEPDVADLFRPSETRWFLQGFAHSPNINARLMCPQINANGGLLSLSMMENAYQQAVVHDYDHREPTQVWMDGYTKCHLISLIRSITVSRLDELPHLMYNHATFMLHSSLRGELIFWSLETSYHPHQDRIRRASSRLFNFLVPDAY